MTKGVRVVGGLLGGLVSFSILTYLLALPGLAPFWHYPAGALCLGGAILCFALAASQLEEPSP